MGKSITAATKCFQEFELLIFQRQLYKFKRENIEVE